jgi:apolipoprotein N-acyltransferase
MKTILFVVLLACAFSGGACSRSDKQPDATVQQTTPNSSLKADAERLQRATAKAAEQRKREQAQQSPTPGVAQP